MTELKNSPAFCKERRELFPQSAEYVVSRHGDVQEVVEYLASGVPENVVVALQKLKRMSSLVTSSDLAKCGVIEPLVDLMVHYDSYEILIINEVIKRLICLTASDSFDEFVLFRNNEFIAALLDFDKNVHYTIGAGAINVIYNLLVDEKTKEFTFLALCELQFPSFIMEKLSGFDDVYSLEEGFDLNEMRERIQYVDIVIKSFNAFIKCQDESVYPEYSETIPYILRLLNNASICNAEVSLELLSNLMKSDENYSIAKSNGVLEALFAKQSSSQPYITRHLYKCFIICIAHEGIGILTPGFYDLLRNDLAAADIRTKESIYQILNMVFEQNPELVVNEDNVSLFIEASSSSLVIEKILACTMLLRIMNVSQEDLCDMIFEQIGDSLGDVLSVCSSAQRDEILQMMISFLTRMPSFIAKVDGNESIVNSLNEITEMDGTSSDLAEQILSMLTSE